MAVEEQIAALEKQLSESQASQKLLEEKQPKLIKAKDELDALYQDLEDRHRVLQGELDKKNEELDASLPVPHSSPLHGSLFG